jgi:hypothetical protein
MVFEDGLTTYSAAQLCNGSYRAVKDAAARYMEKSPLLSREQAANTVVGRIQNFIEYGRTQQWDVKPFHRNFNCPRSEISRVLFDVVLKIGDEGFQVCPPDEVSPVNSNSGSPS